MALFFNQIFHFLLKVLELKEMKTLQKHINYRIAYLLFTWLVTAYILTAYAHLLTNYVPLGGKYREYLICGGQMIFQGLIILGYKKEKLWDYLGNMMTISFAGSILLLPGL